MICWERGLTCGSRELRDSSRVGMSREMWGFNRGPWRVGDRTNWFDRINRTNLFDRTKLTAFSEIFKMASRLWKQQCA